MNALAAVTVPAAVISIGKIFGSDIAASNTARYPAMVAIDDSASMLCARVMRGINSIERKESPARARSDTSRGEVSGSPNPITVWPGRNSARSARPASGFAPNDRT